MKISHTIYPASDTRRTTVGIVLPPLPDLTVTDVIDLIGGLVKILDEMIPTEPDAAELAKASAHLSLQTEKLKTATAELDDDGTFPVNLTIEPRLAAKLDAEIERERREKPVGYLYLQYYVVMRGSQALIYRYTAAGEGRPRINEVEGMIPALRWIDAQRGKPTELQPEALDKLPRYIAEDAKDRRGNLYVIEHPSRGCYVGHDQNSNHDMMPKFRWSIPRTHADVKVFMDRKTAEEKMAAMKIPKLSIIALTGR